jgi:hypothetical protein
MRNRIEWLEREVGAGPRPFEHATDDELRAALERLRRGEPSGLAPYPGPPESWPSSGLEHLSDDEVRGRLGAARVGLAPRHQPETEG